MNIYFRSVLLASATVGIVGCGGGAGELGGAIGDILGNGSATNNLPNGTTGNGSNSGTADNNDSNSSTTGSNSNTGVIDANFSIDISQVSDYDDTDPIDVQYLTVLNYLRSLPITCNDTTGNSGPVPEMKTSDNLTASAKEHSRDMGLSGVYSHTGSGKSSDTTGTANGNDSSFDERIRYNGYTATSGLAENIAMTISSPNPPSANKWIDIMAKWMTSTKGHCSNIMNKNLKDFGMSEYKAEKDSDGYYKVYWTQDFGG